MRDIPRAELDPLPPPVLLALVRLDDFDGFPSDYARTLSQDTLERIHDIAQESEELPGERNNCSGERQLQSLVLVPRANG